MNSRKDPFKEMTLKFMEMTIRRVNQALAMNYATQQALIEAGLISKKQMKHNVAEALQLPTIKVGRDALKEMLDGYDIEAENKATKGQDDHHDKEAIKRIMDMIDMRMPNDPDG